MTTMEQIPRTYEEAIRTLAQWQGGSGDEDLKIYAFPDPEQKVVRLLHISDGFADRGGIHIYVTGSSEEFPFKSAIALTLPKYWEKLRNGEALLPREWNLATAKEVWPDARA